MTENELNEKLINTHKMLAYLIAEYNNCVTTRKALFEEKKAIIQVSVNQTEIPSSLVYMCTGAIRAKQKMLLDQIRAQCSEIDNAIKEYDESEEGEAAEE